MGTRARQGIEYNQGGSKSCKKNIGSQRVFGSAIIEREGWFDWVRELKGIVVYVRILRRYMLEKNLMISTMEDSSFTEKEKEKLLGLKPKILGTIEESQIMAMPIHINHS